MSFFASDMGPWWPYAFVLVAGFLATDCWRWAGVVLGDRIRADSELFRWVRAVATALVAGVIAKVVLFPQGFLGETALALRLAAIGFGYGVYLVAGRHVIVGIVAAEAILIAGMLAAG